MDLNKLFFSSDWHIGEEPQPNNHSYLNKYDKKSTFKELVDSIPEDSTFIFLGDCAVSYDSINQFLSLFENKKLKKIFILGDKETIKIPETSKKSLNEISIIISNAGWQVLEKLELDLNGIKTLVIHKPVDALSNIDDHQMVLCGHIHGVWRTQKYIKDGVTIPFINCGNDAWVNQIVDWKYIEHQYNAVTKGYYDKNCFINI